MQTQIDQKTQQLKSANRFIVQAALISLTLGLAPFHPEPHLWGKLHSWWTSWE